MDSIHVRQRLRPSRYAFLITVGDLTAALQAVSLNMVLWGGVYNPIVPLTPEINREGLLKEFDPDLVVNLTGSPLPSALNERYKHRNIAPDDFVKTFDNSSRRGLGFGFNIMPVIRHVHEKEIRFSSGLTRAVLPMPQAVPGWTEFSGFAYGSYRWLPEMDAKYEDAFQQGLRARVVELLELSSPPNYANSFFPVDFTGYGLRLSGRGSSFSSHVLFIGDHRNLSDLIEFWNIRATGRVTIFVPIAAYQAFELLIRHIATKGRYPLNDQVENNADIQKGPSLSDGAFEQVCDWIARLDLGPLSRRAWCPRYGNETEHCTGDIHVDEIEAIEGVEISIFQNGQMTPVKLIPPPYLDDASMGNGRSCWSIEITMSGSDRDSEFMFTFPNEPAIEAVARRSVMGMPGEVRLGRRGIVIQQQWSRSTLHLIPVVVKDVFQALFRHVGLEVEPSQPGQYAEQIIKKMGDIGIGCRVFKIRGVREILDRLGDDSILTKGDMRQIVISTTPDEQGQNWRPELYSDLVLRFGQKRPLDFSTIFDVLLEKRVIRPGMVFLCRSCFKEDWYHVSEFSEEYTCRYCFATQRVNFGSAKDWRYKADGLFQIPDSAQGSVAVILSLWRLERQATDHVYYITSRNLTARDTGRRCEIDYAFISVSAFTGSYELVLGQATRLGDFTDDDMRKMAELADRFSKKSYLAFSTLKERYSDADKARFRSLSGKGYRVIALTREELDPYHLWDRFKNVPRQHTVGLKGLSENTQYLNVREEKTENGH